MSRSSKPVLVVAAAAAVIAAGSVCWAATPTPDKFTFWLEPVPEAVVHGASGSVVVDAYLEILEGDVQGWSFGVCHADQALATVTDATIEGTDTNTANGGLPPGFFNVNTLPGGATTGVVIDLLQTHWVPPTPKFGILKITYELTSPVEAETTASFCGTLGEPPVENVVVVGGQSITPATMNGTTLKIIPSLGGPLISTSPSQTLCADMSETAQVMVSLGLSDASTQSVELQGWSYGISHDGTKLTLASIAPSSITNTSNGGESPDFYATNINPANGAGGTVGCVISLSPEFAVIPVDPGQMVHTETFTYKSAMALVVGDPNVDVTLAMEHEILGTPPVASVIVVLSEGQRLAEGTMATITLTGDCEDVLRPFRRGDANNDGRVNIADTVWILSWLYRGGLEPPCMDSADANDDGTLDQADAILIAYYRLRGGTPPMAPFPDCGTDPSDTSSDSPADGLGCKANGAGCLP